MSGLDNPSKHQRLSDLIMEKIVKCILFTENRLYFQKFVQLESKSTERIYHANNSDKGAVMSIRKI